MKKNQQKNKQQFKPIHHRYIISFTAHPKTSSTQKIHLNRAKNKKSPSPILKTYTQHYKQLESDLRNKIQIIKQLNDGQIPIRISASQIYKKQQQKKMFQEKCIDLLSRKKNISEKNKNLCKQSKDIETKFYYNYLHNCKITQSDKKNNRNTTSSRPISPTKSDKVKVNQKQNSQHIHYIQIGQFAHFQTTESTFISPNKARISDFISKSTQLNKKKPQKYINQLNKHQLTTNLKQSIRKPQIMVIDGFKCLSMPVFSSKMLKRNVFSSSLIKRNSKAQPTRRVVITQGFNHNTMKFTNHEDGDVQYMKRFKAYFDFLFKINYSNHIYVSLDFNENWQEKYKIQNYDQNGMPISSKKYKAYIGPGNNSLLIKSLLKRRFWFQVVDKQCDNLNFYWTQNKVENAHKYQKKAKQKIKIMITNGGIQINQKTKINQQSEKYQLNKKILNSQEINIVQSLILKDGYRIPFNDTYQIKTVTNHIPNHHMIGSKKRLFRSLYHYYRFNDKNPFDYIPQTYHVTSRQDPQFKRFIQQNRGQPDKIWIIKPGQNTNRGNGIKLAKIKYVSSFIKNNQKHQNGDLLTFIIQSYIDKPFLYNSRKFDIRHYFLVSSVNGILKAYWYKQGYIRTSSEIYDLTDLDNIFIHLTNDAIQKNSDNYQNFQLGNKLSYAQFQRYLDQHYPHKNYNFERDIVKKMKQIIIDVTKANFFCLDPRRNQCNFQIFGFDFMIDSNFKPWLIQINSNPCLQVNNPLLNRIIPQMVECSLRIGLDPLLPPRSHFPTSKRFYLSDNYLKNLKYQLIFDETTLKQPIKILQIQDDQGDQQQQQYCDDGKQIDDLII